MASTATPSQATTRRAAPRSRSMSSTHRTSMIAEAAYYIAEQRGFSGGDPVQDWLDAETQIDQLSASTKRKTKAR